MIRSQQKMCFKNNGLQDGVDDSRTHYAQGRSARFSPISDPGEKKESTGGYHDPAARVKHDVVNFLVRRIPVVEGFGHRPRHVPPDPEQYENPDQPLFHSSFISQSKVGSQLVR